MLYKGGDFMTFFYTETKETYKDRHWIRESVLPYLYSYGSDGKYRKTKMTVEKIKENQDYGYGYYQKKYGWLSLKGVKHMVYKPNIYTEYFKDDCLFINYSDKPITKQDSDDGWYDGYDLILDGWDMVNFVWNCDIDEHLRNQIIKQIEQRVLDGNKIQEKSCFPILINIDSLPWRKK
jgi:hypothetical protein